MNSKTLHSEAASRGWFDRHLPIKERFWRRVEVSGPDDCWNWKYSVVTNGYGNFKFGGKTRTSHRTAFELENGQIPHGMMVCHKCDNRRCCNPKHLFLGTGLDNVRDCINKGRRRKQLFGEKHYSAKLTESQVITILSDYRDNKIKQCELAARYGVSKGAIGGIVRGLRWRHLQT